MPRLRQQAMTVKSQTALERDITRVYCVRNLSPFVKYIPIPILVMHSNHGDHPSNGLAVE